MRKTMNMALAAVCAATMVLGLMGAVPVEAARGAGCGGNATGGNGGRVISVSTWAALDSAIAATGRRIIIVSGSLNGGGAELQVDEPNVTIKGPATIVNGWLSVRASNVIVRNLRIRVGDRVSAIADADAISINGGSDVLIDHVEAVLGPDIGGISVLNESRNVTIQQSIVGAGLFRSAHPEANEDADGHSYALNIAALAGHSAPRCVTIYRNLITTSEGRNVRVMGGSRIDYVNNVIYNFTRGPQGNPRGLNIVGNVYRQGPAPEAAGLVEKHWPFSTQTDADRSTPFPGSVYLANNAADGFTFTGVEVPAGVLSRTPVHALSVPPERVGGLLGRVLFYAGPTPDAMTNAWLADVRNRTGKYWNGCGRPAPTFCP
jgi:hypothetical protein